MAFNAIGVDVQALSFAANSEVAALLESQDKTMLQQNNEIIRLTLAQLIFCCWQRARWRGANAARSKSARLWKT